jgi:hypothetical protein
MSYKVDIAARAIQDALMDQSECNLVEAYIRANDVTGDDSFSWANDELRGLVWQEPERAWPVILSIVERNPANWVLASLGAGPLEDLLQAHGPLFIDRVEQEARRNERFRRRVLARVYHIACRPTEVAERIRHLIGNGLGE